MISWYRLLFFNSNYYNKREFFLWLFKKWGYKIEYIDENRCPFCGRRFNNRWGLITHLRYCPAFIEAYNNAELIYFKAKAIIEHIRRPTNGYRYYCRVCLERFRDKTEALKHAYLEHLEKYIF